jgi:hypothetical protein
MKVRRLRGPGKQLRGAELKERIGSVLQEFVREAELRGEKPTISFGDLAKLIPCSTDRQRKGFGVGQNC